MAQTTALALDSTTDYTKATLRPKAEAQGALYCKELRVKRRVPYRHQVVFMKEECLSPVGSQPGGGSAAVE